MSSKLVYSNVLEELAASIVQANLRTVNWLENGGSRSSDSVATYQCTWYHIPTELDLLQYCCNYIILTFMVAVLEVAAGPLTQPYIDAHYIDHIYTHR